MLNVYNIHKKLGHEEIEGLLYHAFKSIPNLKIQTSVLSLACLWFNEVHLKDSSVYASILENVLFYDTVEDEDIKEAMYLAILEEIPSNSFFVSYLSILSDQSLMVITAGLVNSFVELSVAGSSDYHALIA